MTVLVLAARLALAAVFLVSGLTKLADRSGSRQAVTGFGVPAALAGPIAGVLPLLELAIALALLPVASSVWGAVVGTALLIVFTAAIALNLARGRKPDCHCFGQLSSEPIGWSTALRNAALLAVAGFVIAFGRTPGQISAVAWLGALSAAETAGLVLSLAALALAGTTIWLLLQLLAQNGRLFNRLEQIEQRLAPFPNGAALNGLPALASGTPPVGLAPGTPAPAFDLNGLYGEHMTLDALRSSGAPVLLLFTDPDCGHCNELLPDVGRWQRNLAGTLNVILISRGDIEANRAKRNDNNLGQVLLQDDWEVSERYQTTGTPSAVLVRADGTIGSYVAQGAEEIRALVSRQLGSQVPLVPYVPSSPLVPAAPPQPEGLPVGTQAPALKLPDLHGKQVDLAGLRGRDTLLVFWNPGCGFCQQLLPQLKDWEERHSAKAPNLLLLSAGSVEDNRAHGFKSTIVLDDNFNAGAAFRASGTPSGVLVDAEGKIASPLGVGGPAVMALANQGDA
jgi:peroxiredoxin/uncharacterized membrane protein YphA (DoxX/SURF4 family)